jgi:hypothetical protein
LGVERNIAWRGHDARTVQEAGWSGKKNCKLLVLAETKFDVLVTIDTNLQYQQNLSEHRIAIIVTRSLSNRLEDLQIHSPNCVSILQTIQPGDIVYMMSRLPFQGKGSSKFVTWKARIRKLLLQQLLDGAEEGHLRINDELVRSGLGCEVERSFRPGGDDGAEKDRVS